MTSATIDVGIVGSGPAAIAVAIDAQKAGLTVQLFDKGPVAGHITRFPYFMRFFSTPELLELGNLPLMTTAEKPSREEYLQYLRKAVKHFRIPIRTYEQVISIEGNIKSGFILHTQDRIGHQHTCTARRIVIANGAYSQPRMLNIPGEELPKVSHYFTEVHPYFGTKVLIIGAGNSAVETALLLCRNGADVSLSYRQPEISGVKYWLLPDINNRIAEGAVTAYFNTQPIEIRKEEVDLKNTLSGEITTFANDFVLALTGYEPELSLLQSAGIEIEPESKTPNHNPETLESNIPGIYIAGVITAGNVSSHVFIENSRFHGQKILPHLQASLSARS